MRHYSPAAMTEQEWATVIRNCNLMYGWVIDPVKNKMVQASKPGELTMEQLDSLFYVRLSSIRKHSDFDLVLTCPTLASTSFLHFVLGSGSRHQKELRERNISGSNGGWTRLKLESRICCKMTAASTRTMTIHRAQGSPQARQRTLMTMKTTPSRMIST
jgi:hypothetical protein